MVYRETAPLDESDLQKKIDLLKDSSPYKEKFATREAQELTQAIDLLSRLCAEFARTGNQVGYNLLGNAKDHLEKVLKEYLKGSI
jgi:hypothetical protein